MLCPTLEQLPNRPNVKVDPLIKQISIINCARWSLVARKRFHDLQRRRNQQLYIEEEGEKSKREREEKSKKVSVRACACMCI